jgi:AcrR family transcriptional regulator
VTELPTRRLEAVVALLLESLTRTLRTAASLRTGADGAYDEDRIVDAFTDVVHRTLFGPLPGLNVREATTTTPPTLDPGPVLRAVGRRDHGGDELTATGRRTLESLLRAGQDVFVRRGYHQTRVDDIVTEAGVSHGAFYRYFQNKDDLAHTIAVGAMRRVSTTFGAMPEMTPGGSDEQRSELRRWLRRYEEAYSTEYAVIQVWVDAAVEDPSLADDSAAVVDWGRRRMADFLRSRGFGDVDHESVVMLALLVTFGNRTDDDGSLDAAAYVVERGLFAT